MFNKYKLEKEISNLKLLLKYFYRYSFNLGIWSFIDGIAQRLKLDKLCSISHKRRYDECKRYIRKNYYEIIAKYKKIEETANPIGKEGVIWIYWGQGFDNLPFPVEKTIESIKRNCKDRKIIMLSDENLYKYISLKEYIIKKYKEKKISKAEFSDLVRINVLKDYGGIWLDSTYYFTENLDKKISDYAFYSICFENKREWVITKDRWSISFLAIHPNSKLMNFVCEIYDKYWELEDTLIGYLLTDCIISIAYEEYPDIKEMINAVPSNNLGVFDFLQANVNEACSRDEYNNYVKGTYIHKLTYKMNYKLETHNKKTYIGRLLDE